MCKPADKVWERFEKALKSKVANIAQCQCCGIILNNEGQQLISKQFID